jgi:hypothetical protein
VSTMARAVVFVVAAVAAAAGVAAAWRAGASSASIIPLVGGRNDYVVPLPDEDADSPGTFVLEWDFGRISIGNGDTQSHWVRDDLRTQAAAIEDDAGTIAVFSSTEVYMFFEPDINVYQQKVREEVGDAVFARLRFFTHGQHNHEGPDTSGLGGPVNRQYFDYLYGQLVQTTVEAIQRLQPAELSFGETKHAFGLGDGRDPIIYDRTLHVLRATPANNASAPPIFSLVQWGMHPEVTLGFQPKVPDADCIALGRAPGCSARGQFMTGDYPGILRRVLKGLDKSGEVIYYNGAIGAQIGNRGPVWEVSEQFPVVGDGGTLPEGAVDLPNNFRNAFLIGQQLAIAAANVVTATRIPSDTFDYRTTREYSRLTNPLFRIGLCPAIIRQDPVPLVLGYALRELFVCTGTPSPSTCVSDNFRCNDTRVPQRVGDFASLIISYLRLGPLRFVTLPGEFSPELVIGVPRDFDTPEGTAKYFKRPDLHPVGPDFTLPGTVFAMLNCTKTSPCFVLGLTGDEMGYVMPICDWRLACLGSEEDCLADYNAGAMTYPDSMSGERCNEIVEDVEGERRDLTVRYGADTANRVVNACLYGQVRQAAEASQHYEEINSGGWNGAGDYFKGLSAMMGVPIAGRYQLEEED